MMSNFHPGLPETTGYLKELGNEDRSVSPFAGHMEADLPNQVVGKFDGCIYLKGYPRGVTVDRASVFCFEMCLFMPIHLDSFNMFVLDDIGECRNHLSFEVHAGTRMSG